MEKRRVKNHSDELIFHSQGLRRSAANLVRSHRRIRLREILLACLSAKRFDMEVKVGKKAKRVPVNLDAGDVAELQPDEISAILRAADELIGKEGRTLLSKILKGSKEKRVPK